MHDAAGGPYKHIARIDLTGLYPATLRDVFDPSAYPGGKPAWTDKRLVLEHGELHGIEGGQANMPGGPHGPVDMNFTAGTLTSDGLRLSQLPSPPDISGNAIALTAAVEEHMSQDAASVRDVSFSVTGASPVHGSLGRSTTSKYDGGRVADFSLQDFKLGTDKPAGTMSLDGASGHGLDISKMLAVLPVLAADPGKPHPELINGMHIDDAEMHGLRVDYPTGPLVTIDRISGGSASADRSGHFSIKALSIKTSGRPLAPATRQQLDAFGMADFTTDMDEEGGYDRDAGALNLKRCDIDFHDLGTLHLTLDVTGVTPVSAMTPAQMQQTALAARLTGAAIIWDDASLTSRLLKMAAARQGVTPDQVRMGLALPLASLAMFMPEQPDAVAQVNAFLSGQHHLGVTMKPPVPVGLMQWQTTPVQQRAALLGAKVSGS